MRNVKDLFVLFQSVNSKKEFNCLRIMCGYTYWCICFEELFVILLAYVDLINSSKFSGHPESKAVFMRECII